MAHVQTKWSNGAAQATNTMGVGGAYGANSGSQNQAIASGDGVVGFGFFNSTTTPTAISVADDATTPNTYNVPNGIVTVTSGIYAFQFWLTHITNVTGSLGAILATITGADITSFALMGFSEFSTELGSGKTLDKSNLADGNTATGTNGFKTAAVTTASNGELIYTWALGYSGAATLTAGTTPATWTIDVNDGGDQWYSEYLTQTTAGSIQGTWTATDAVSSYILGLMTFGPSVVQNPFMFRDSPNVLAIGDRGMSRTFSQSLLLPLSGQDFIVGGGVL